MRQRKLAAPIARCPFPRSSTFDSPSNKGSSSFQEILSRSVGSGDWLPTPIVAEGSLFSTFFLFPWECNSGEIVLLIL